MGAFQLIHGAMLERLGNLIRSETRHLPFNMFYTTVHFRETNVVPFQGGDREMEGWDRMAMYESLIFLRTYSTVYYKRLSVFLGVSSYRLSSLRLLWSFMYFLLRSGDGGR